MGDAIGGFLKKFTSAYLFQIARVKSCDYIFVKKTAYHNTEAKSIRKPSNLRTFKWIMFGSLQIISGCHQKALG